MGPWSSEIRCAWSGETERAMAALLSCQFSLSLHTTWNKHSRTVFNSSLLTIHLNKITAKEKRKNTELINVNWENLPKKDNLKYNKWIRKQAKKITGKIITRSVRQLRIQLDDWFTWRKNKTFKLNWTNNNRPNELTKIGSNGYSTQRQE